MTWNKVKNFSYFMLLWGTLYIITRAPFVLIEKKIYHPLIITNWVDISIMATLFLFLYLVYCAIQKIVDFPLPSIFQIKPVRGFTTSLLGFGGWVIIYFLLIEYYPLQVFKVPIKVFFTLGLSTFPSVFISALHEELLNRGILQGYLQAKYGTRIAIGGQSVIFTLTHLGLIFSMTLRHFFSIFLLGILFGLQTKYSCGLIISTSAHTLWNLIGRFLLYKISYMLIWF